MNTVTENNVPQISSPTQTAQPQFWARLSEAPLRLQVEPELKPAQTMPTRAGQVHDPKPRLSRQIALLLALALFSVVSYYCVSRFVVTAVVVQGRSMAPTLQDGERYFLNRWLYLWKTPQRGDVVVIHDPGHTDYAVKRIIAGPKDSLRFVEGAIYVNGQKLKETYLAAGTTTTFPDDAKRSLKLGEGQFYVMGDNRANSEDSRVYGTVPRAQIVGLICK